MKIVQINFHLKMKIVKPISVLFWSTWIWAVAGQTGPQNGTSCLCRIFRPLPVTLQDVREYFIKFEKYEIVKAYHITCSLKTCWNFFWKLDGRNMVYCGRGQHNRSNRTKDMPTHWIHLQSWSKYTFRGQNVHPIQVSQLKCNLQSFIIIYRCCHWKKSAASRSEASVLMHISMGLSWLLPMATTIIKKKMENLKMKKWKSLN